MQLGKTILAVDDSASMRNMVAFTARSAGYDVVEACDGVDALAKAKQHRFSLVLTDQNMPNMDGFTLIESLRGLPAYQTTPILVLTTESSSELKAKGKAVKATGWLTKPFDPQVLVDVLARVLP